MTTKAFNPFDQEISTLDLNAESITQDDEVVILEEESNPRTATGDWRYVMGDANPMPDIKAFFAYDLEAVPDYHFPRPDETELPDINLDLDAVLKTEATVKQRLSDGLNKAQVQELLHQEQHRPKPRQGVCNALVSHIENGNKDVKAWKDLAKNPATARIVAMAMCCFTDPVPRVWIARNEDEERTLLYAFLEQHESGRIRTGYNIASYDDRLIAWRCMKLGIAPAHPLHCSRFGGKQSIDVALKLFSGVADMMKLKTVLPMLGIHPPAGAVDGSMVLDMVDGGQWEDLAMYVASDAWSEMELFKRIQQVMEV